jgi:hypothetical protein
LPTKSLADPVYVFAAIEGTAPALAAEGMPGGGPPRAVALVANAALIVSNVPAHIYNTTSLEASLSDLDWVAKAGAAHHAVVDALAEAGVTVLPFGLFTVFSNEERALTTLRESMAPIERALARVRGKQEWVLKIGKPDSARAERIPPAPETTSGTSFLAAKATARRHAAERTTRATADAAAVCAALERLADAARTKVVDPRGDLMLDAAFLVPRDRVAALHGALTTAADRLLRDGCKVSLTGPWPPYSFSSLDANGDA